MKTTTNKATARPFKSEWTPCSREWFNDLAKFRSEQGKFESERDALVAVAEAALKCEAALQQHLLGSENLDAADIRWRLEAALNSTREALANLADVRGGGK